MSAMVNFGRSYETRPGAGDAPSPDLPDLAAEGGGSTHKSHSWRHRRVIGLTRKQSDARNCRLRPAHASSSSSALASFRSAVSKPSVNQP